MNITKEQMLKWLWDKQIEADDLMEGDEFNMVVAIRALIESSGEKASGTDEKVMFKEGDEVWSLGTGPAVVVKSAPSPAPAKEK